MKKVLFVDDEADYLRILRLNFAKECDATFVYTGAEALMQIKNEKFDVVVLDMGLFLDGATIVKLANGRLKDSKVYFLSCHDKGDLEKMTAPIKDRIAGVYNKEEFHLLKAVILDLESRK